MKRIFCLMLVVTLSASAQTMVQLEERDGALILHLEDGAFVYIRPGHAQYIRVDYTEPLARKGENILEGTSKRMHLTDDAVFVEEIIK